MAEHLRGWIVLVTMALLAMAQAAWAEPVRLKDLVSVRGVRSNYLNGFGLVVGLKGTGDTKKSIVTNKAVANMLTRMGMKINAEEVVAGNMAAVMVTADLPAFHRIGETIDAKVSVIGDAKSLAGGTLILTPLRAGNSEIYAVAQGAVVVGQASGAGAQVLTVARVPGGATVEKEFVPNFAPNGHITLSLNSPDFTTGSNIAETLNQNLRGFYAEALDPASVDVRVQEMFAGRLVEFVAEIEKMTTDSDLRAVVVLNERTGTVVMGKNVMIDPIAISHGDLSIRVGEKGKASKDAKGKVVVPVGTVGDLIETMNALGVKPTDLVGILQAIHAAGALKAELKFM
ncbi:flagellar P-ring protein [Planctomyces bekefii]|uniref:Flagellar P-ring protein n=1 Tax=Planctomyces bekefii TaxID=1653850 RepID=A0A5C6MA07_9PLAN|nr:flagellar P-ring protein [Planctomyces bekefii]